ncbi:hypothetical protein HID58_012563 [Brassica napus]|uniref:Uncharacterized protein n=1 Tax=Brassica napus TaxID=3708 RepID=A0ABQ8E1F0_BRANA|nr:hypothetical protein HID58_012563 [Brassica napus]
MGKLYEQFKLYMFDDHGNDLELLSEELVSMWSVGVGLEFATEWTFLVGWTRGLWLVSLNQLQFVSLERLRSFNMGKYGSVALYVSGVYTDLFLFYVKNMYYIVAFAIMVFTMTIMTIQKVITPRG